MYPAACQSNPNESGQTKTAIDRLVLLVLPPRQLQPHLEPFRVNPLQLKLFAEALLRLVCRPPLKFLLLLHTPPFRQKQSHLGRPERQLGSSPYLFVAGGGRLRKG